MSHELLRGFERGRAIVLEQRRCDRARHASREHDQAAVVLREQVHVDARLVVIALEKALRDQRREVLIPFIVGCQQRDVRLVAHGAIEAAARRDIRLATDDRLESVLACAVVKFDRAEHHAVIGQRDAGHAFIGAAAAQRVDPAGTVEERVLAVNVEMNERRIRHGVGLFWEARGLSLRAASGAREATPASALR